jgi:hypothetical protein
MDPAFFVSSWQDYNKKSVLFQSFFAYYFLKVNLHQSSNIKSHKELKKIVNRNQGFSYFFCLLMEGSVSGSTTRFAQIMTKTYTGLFLCLRQDLSGSLS